MKAKTFNQIQKDRKAKTFSEIIEKFNPYHDRLGRFSSSGGAASFTYAPGKSKAHDMAIAREKDRISSGGAASALREDGASYNQVDGKTFNTAFYKAYDTMTDEQRWRVGTDYTEEDYNHAKCFVSPGGSTIAVKDGDIVSVCKAKGDKVRASQMLQKAVDEGGVKLDAFGDKLYNLYTKNGFEPVSRCAFDDNFAPDAWKRANGFNDGDTSWHGKPDTDFVVKREDIVFYKHTGKTTNLSYEEFRNKTPLSSDYGEAQSIRDGGL